MHTSAHTPGPWRDGSHRTIESQSGSICEIYSHMGIAEADANQRLIAAATELLDAAQAAAAVLGRQKWLEGSTDPEAVALCKLRAAISKAIGNA